VNTWYGTMFGCWLPSRAGFSPVARKFMAWLASQATCASSMPMSICWPCPVASRWRKAARMPMQPYSPANVSATEAPTFCGSPSGAPVMLITPPIAWIRLS
jgi:hypothetical protein